MAPLHVAAIGTEGCNDRSPPGEDGDPYTEEAVHHFVGESAQPSVKSPRLTQSRFPTTFALHVLTMCKDSPSDGEAREILHVVPQIRMNALLCAL